MNEISYEERAKVYDEAIATFGAEAQMVVAMEEMSELQKEICKVLRGGGNMMHLSEEVADATIMLEQLRQVFGINDEVCQFMDQKVLRLQHRIESAKEPMDGGNKVAGEKTLIDAKMVKDKLWAVFSWFGEVPCTEQDKLAQAVIKQCIGEVDKLPRADAAPVVHGRWEEIGVADYKCTRCGFRFTSADPITMFQYCRCGAKMDGDGNEI